MRALCTALLVALPLALPASSQAAVTFGSSLVGAAPGSSDLGCGGGEAECTSALEVVQGGPLARSPIEGVVVRWRLRTNAAQGGSVRLRILRDLGGNNWFFERSGPHVGVPAAVAAHVFPSRVRIAAGEYIGLDRPATLTEVFRTSATGAVTNLFQPPPLDGETASHGGDSGRELLINADVEPDADRDGFGDETQDACPTDAATQGPCVSSVGTQGTPVVLDRRDPRLRLAIKRVQDIDKLSVSARMDENGTLAASGFVQAAKVRRLPRASRALRLRRVRRAARARRRVKLRLKMPRKSVRRVKRAMRRGQVAVATVTVTATDRAGNAKKVRRRIRLTP
jgi:hypothetical protein